MSKSSLIKLILFLGILVFPSFVSAKTLQFEDQTWEINPTSGRTTAHFAIRNDMDLSVAARNAILGEDRTSSRSLFDESTAKTINELQNQINQSAQDAHIVIEGKVAKEFTPDQNGQGLDVYELSKLIRNHEPLVTLPVLISTPTKKLSETNNLGINELIAIGESDFTGSPKNRIHNITVGAAKFNGLIIDKGEEFSFNKYLGDVDGEHGFLPELVIKKSGVVPEFGGGLCQVSSTAFRGAMNAGMPITDRRNHSFAVQYYAPQGTDATIYPGVQDLKFINDTPGSIVVRARIEDKKLFFEYYGSKDTRSVAFEGPVQYDKQSNGAMKATWTRHVTKDGEKITQTFSSIYQPPALFHPEEQAATPNPETVATINNQPVTAGTNTEVQPQ
jgi:vancomycin resistance protein YoaR